MLAGGAAALLTMRARARPMTAPARIALTFDYYPQVVAARNIMSDLQIYTATYYAWHPNIVTGVPSGNQIAVADVALMKQLGWEIGAYTQDNMVTKLAADRVAANNWLRDIDHGMDAAGFKVATIAPNQRSWSASLANLARGRFKGVRVAGNYASPIVYPISDPLNINDGGANSWGSDATANAGSNSVAAILARADALIPTCGTRVEIIHKIGNAAAVAADPVYTLLDTQFAAVMSGYATRIAAGDLQLITMEQALSAQAI